MDGRGREREEKEEEGRKRTGEDQREGKWMAGEERGEEGRGRERKGDKRIREGRREKKGRGLGRREERRKEGKEGETKCPRLPIYEGLVSQSLAVKEHSEVFSTFLKKVMEMPTCFFKQI